MITIFIIKVRFKVTFKIIKIKLVLREKEEKKLFRDFPGFYCGCFEKKCYNSCYLTAC